MPVDVIDLAVGKQRYGLLLNDEGGIIDDLMFFNKGNNEIFVIVNGACKAGDIAHIQTKIGKRCQDPHARNGAIGAARPASRHSLVSAGTGCRKTGIHDRRKLHREYRRRRRRTKD
jgi:glycine cleavage system aminomethyltransferase T